MDNNIKAFRINLALAWFSAGLALFALFGLVVSAILFYFEDGLLQIFAGIVLSYLPLPAIAITSCLFTLFHCFVAQGAAKQKTWSLWACRFIGSVFLFLFPIGTIVGVYLLSTTWKNWAQTEFQLPMNEALKQKDLMMGSTSGA